jgi:hypothetical protein
MVNMLRPLQFLPYQAAGPDALQESADTTLGNFPIRFRNIDTAPPGPHRLHDA